MEVGFKADLFVEEKVIVEIKSVECVMPIHKKQLLSYLRLSKLQIGLLINFNEELIKKGLTRLVNNYVKGSSKNSLFYLAKKMKLNVRKGFKNFNFK